MKRRSFRPAVTTLRIALAMGLVLSSFSTLAMAQGYIPPNRGLPGRREGGGTRGNCLDQQQQLRTLVALNPTTNFSVTVSELPTLYWFVPQSTAKSAEFVLSNAQGEELYTLTFPITGQAGIISVKLPAIANSTALEIGKDYQWSFTVVCDTQDLSGNPSTSGWIQRREVTPELTQQLAGVAEGDRFSVYRNAGIWQEALTNLAEQRRKQPNDPSIQSRWRDLLQSVGLEGLASAPIVSCCEAPTNLNR